MADVGFKVFIGQVWLFNGGCYLPGLSRWYFCVFTSVSFRGDFLNKKITGIPAGLIC